MIIYLLSYDELVNSFSRDSERSEGSSTKAEIYILGLGDEFQVGIHF